MRIRSLWFVLSGALGGLVGFALMEMVSRLVPGAGTRSGDILRMSIYFAGFGLAVGAALGMTEGVVLKKPWKIAYGLILGLFLGTVGGFAGGAIGQFIYGLVPLKYASHSTADIAIILDSSGSMGWLFFGSDPHHKRQEASKQLVDRVSDTDRVAVVDFNSTARLLFPLSFMSSAAARDAAKGAIDQVGAGGGTNLSAGLDTGLQELVAKQQNSRRQFVIFLTDGVGDYTPETARRAQRAGITIYTVGLGNDVSADLLRSIAAASGGQYYPVENASSLTALFEQIFTKNIDMTSGGAGLPAPGTQPLNSPAVLFLLRVLSWAAMGLAIGLGQGVRENTREDLWACSLGGLVGGGVGGALFDPVTSLLTIGGGLAGRALADVLVGACIGGSMRLAQETMVATMVREPTTLLAMLPKKTSLAQQPIASARRVLHSSAAPPEPLSTTELPRGLPLSPAPRSATSVGPRQPLSSFEIGNDRERAMALAYRSGHYSLREIAEHFRVPASTVKRAADQHALR